MSKIEDILSDILKALDKSKKEKTKPYDTTATVTRVEGKTAYVHIPGGVDETPVTMSIDCKAGDTVNVRVSGGRAWITGNNTAPPTDDSTALGLYESNKDDIISISKSLKTETEERKAQITMTAEQIQSQVSSTYLTKDSAASTYATQTLLNQTAESISTEVSKKVGNDEIISKINQTAETIVIDADKIDLSGYVTFTNLATSGETEIDGANITTGTVSADRIDVDGIFAKDITATGTISGAKLSGGTITIGDNFAVDASGNMTASNATLNGSIYATFAQFVSALLFKLPTSPTTWGNALWTNIEEDSPAADKLMVGMDFDQVVLAGWAALQSGLTVAGTSELKGAATFQNTAYFNGNIVTNSTINGNSYQYVTLETVSGLSISVASGAYQDISSYKPTKSGYTLTSFSIRTVGSNAVHLVHPGMNSPYLVNVGSSSATISILYFTCVWTK